MEKVYSIKYWQYNVNELGEQDAQLVAEAEKAVKKAYAKYSHFNVGAAIRLKSGKILHGANAESEVYPSTICAERSVLFYAEVNYPDDPIEAIAIASSPSEKECYPCGNCRQVILDVQRKQNSPIRVIMAGGGTASIVERAEGLLPFTFSLD